MLRTANIMKVFFWYDKELLPQKFCKESLDLRIIYMYLFNVQVF